jgi:hypothetical protein
VSRPDFELSGRLQAHKLRCRRPPRPQTEAETVRLDRRDRRRGPPKRIEPETDYDETLVERRVEGRID